MGNIQWKKCLVYGTGTSAHDVAQDLYVHGANVKIVQRSPSMVVNVEPSAQLLTNYIVKVQILTIVI